MEGTEGRQRHGVVLRVYQGWTLGTQVAKEWKGRLGAMEGFTAGADMTHVWFHEG